MKQQIIVTPIDFNSSDKDIGQPSVDSPSDIIKRK